MLPASVPGYYQRLTEYFPQQELKPLGQFSDLLEHQPCYLTLENDRFLLLYAELPNCLFIDFMIVDSRYRNQRVGSRLLDHLKEKGVPIVLEVEPADPAIPDTMLRRKFYLQNGFRIAENILYRRKNQQGNPFDMDIFYWSPSGPMCDEEIIALMTQVCTSVHNFHAMTHYGRLPADPQKVLSLRRVAVGREF